MKLGALYPFLHLVGIEHAEKPSHVTVPLRNKAAIFSSYAIYFVFDQCSQLLNLPPHQLGYEDSYEMDISLPVHKLN